MALALNDINGAAECFLEIEDQFAEVEDAALSVHIYQKIQVAARPSVAARNRPEHADVPRSVSLSNSDDLLAASAKVVECKDSIGSDHRRLRTTCIGGQFLALRLECTVGAF